MSTTDEQRTAAETLGELRRVVAQEDIDFIDLGSSSGGSLVYGIKKLGLSRGLGVDIDPLKVHAAREAGHLIVQADATLLRPDTPIVSTVVAMHFLEHVPTADIAQSVLRSAAALASDLVFVRQPYFDADDYLAARGLRLYWSDWSGHPNRMSTYDFQDVLDELVEVGALAGYEIYGAMPVLGSGDEVVIPTSAPRNQQNYDAALHGPKPSGDFERPVFRETCVVAYKDADSPVVNRARELFTRETLLHARPLPPGMQPRGPRPTAPPDRGQQSSGTLVPPEEPLEALRTSLLMLRRWGYLRYLHLREALINCPDVETVLAIGCGRGLAETALAVEFPERRFHLTDIAPQNDLAQTLVQRYALNNVTFGQIDILGDTTGTYDLVSSIEVLHLLDNPARAADSMRNLARRHIFGLVPLAASVEADHTSGLKLREVGDGFDPASLAELFPSSTILRGCYWLDRGVLLRKRLEGMSDLAIREAKQQLLAAAEDDVRRAAESLTSKKPPARGVWFLTTE